MHMWSVFPWPGRTMGASFALLGWANPSFPPAALRFKQWLGVVSVAAAERRHHRIFLLGRRWVILGWTVVMQMLQSTMATYHRSQANTFLPHTVPRPLKEKSRMGACDAWNLCSSRLTLFWIFSVVLNLLRICQMNSKAEGRLLVLEDSGPAWWWCGGWSIYLLMTDMLENSTECAAGKGIINKGLAVAQKSEFSWLMMLKRVCFFSFLPPSCWY